jgi:hypothetical protein
MSSATLQIAIKANAATGVRLCDIAAHQSCVAVMPNPKRD